MTETQMFMWEEPGDPPADVLADLPVETVVFRPGVGPLGWWDGQSLQPVEMLGIWAGDSVIPDPEF